MQVGRNGMLREMFMVKVSHANLHGHFYLKFSCIMFKNGQTYLKSLVFPLIFLLSSITAKLWKALKERVAGNKIGEPSK